MEPDTKATQGLNAFQMLRPKATTVLPADEQAKLRPRGRGKDLVFSPRGRPKRDQGNSPEKS